MAQHQYEVEARSGRCVATGKELAEGEAFYTVLFEDGESFKRADYSLEGWKGPPEGSFCHFRTRVPVKDKKKNLLVNDEVLAHFFQRLADETELVRIQFRFVLALILMRKRKLRYDGSARGEEGEVWRMTLMADRSSHDVLNPDLTDEQIEGVSQQLTAILHSDMGEWATPPEKDEDAGISDERPVEAREPNTDLPSPQADPS